MKKRTDTSKLVNELNESKFFAKRIPDTTPKKSGLDGSPLFLRGKEQRVKDNSKDKRKDNSKDSGKDEVKDNSKDNHKDVFKDLQSARQKNPNLPTADDVERMVFEFRKADKTRFNGDIPQEWKDEIDAYADRIGVGKYNMLMYAVGKFLGKL